MSLSVIILAGGKGKRMVSSLPKVLHRIGGTTLLQHVVRIAQKLDPKKINVVYGNGGSMVKDELSFLPVNWVEQKKQLGTGHAVLQALPHCDDNDTVLILYGDTPLVRRTTLERLLKAVGKSKVAFLVAEVTDPTGLGRIIRDKQNHILRIVEQKDATNEQKEIREINTGIVAAPAKLLKKWLPNLKNNNSQKEYYLTDIVEIAADENIPVAGVTTHDQGEVQGINDCWQLSLAERFYQKRLAKKLMMNGVRIVDPERIDFRSTDFEIAPDVTLDINVIIKGKVKIGSHTKIGPNVSLKDVEIGEGVTVKAHSVLEGAVIKNDCIVGPFARIRPETTLEQNTHIGNFVEIKKSTIGEGSKANHLTYIGDATIGKDVNVGAGVITCNYDGANKWETIIGDNAFIGSNVALVAPINIGEGATVGAGSTLNKDAPEKQLTVARTKQATISNWQRPTKQNGQAEPLQD